MFFYVEICHFSENYPIAKRPAKIWKRGRQKFSEKLKLSDGDEFLFFGRGNWDDMDINFRAKKIEKILSPKEIYR